MRDAIHRPAPNQARYACTTLSNHDVPAGADSKSVHPFKLGLALFSSLLMRLAVGALTLGAFSALGIAQSQVILKTTETTKANSSDPVQKVWADVIEQKIKYVTNELKRKIKSDEIPLLLSANGKMATPEGEIYVSIALQRSCVSGANNFGSRIEPSQCRARIFRIEDGKAKIIAEGPACLIEPDESGNIVYQNNTVVTYNSGNTSLKFQTVVYGKIWDDCTYTIDIGKSK
jgi:hypothetical protein